MPTEHDNHVPVKVAVVCFVRFEVNDFEVWKKAFDAQDAARKGAGFIGYAVFQDLDNPNAVMIGMPGTDPHQIQTFVASPEFASVMVMNGPPEVMFTATPVEDSDVSRDTKVAVHAFVFHRVENFDAWLAAFHGNQANRDELGLIAYFIVRGLDDESTVAIHYKGTDVEAVRTAMESKEQEEIIHGAGILGPAQVFFATKHEQLYPGEG